MAKEVRRSVGAQGTRACLPAHPSCSSTPPCRPNLVVGGTAAYAEDSWRSVRVEARGGGAPAARLQAAGPCTRCDMVCYDPLTGR